MNPNAMPDLVVELSREAIWIALLISAPILLAGLVAGLVIGLLQAVTQIQEQTVAFIPKLVVMILVIGFTLPWLINQMVQYSTDLIGTIPTRLH